MMQVRSNQRNYLQSKVHSILVDTRAAVGINLKVSFLWQQAPSQVQVLVREQSIGRLKVENSHASAGSEQYMMWARVEPIDCLMIVVTVRCGSKLLET